ncbi:hypothetical protein M427DRAFT_257668 [Gonapodya prolifera JEL478]|uniref:Uncharacterized protein n=1 Tax=Gonapodya prolifera (strain JEL478) TaxID=1344416 RepID=A0A138ZX62_GONPJ|nr:hypothetical protein M427DRAFT_257668 [Gonapodya prolifera JEL478]|eukprot:KXS09044.1 hypothetical protein M427DRAFT_257668 [Gonapodya prolifera JEL478]
MQTLLNGTSSPQILAPDTTIGSEMWPEDWSKRVLDLYFQGRVGGGIPGRNLMEQEN